MKTVKAIILLILIPVVTIGQLHAISVNNRDTSKTLYKYDFRKCLFTIKTGDWTTHQGKNVLPVTATLNNTANDTLEYETMTYRMLGYNIKSNNLEYEYVNEDILKNFPEIVKIPPHQSRTFSFNLIKKNVTSAPANTLQVGFCLVLPKENNGAFLFEDPFTNDDSSAYTMDSNGNFIPHKKELAERTHWLWSNIIKI